MSCRLPFIPKTRQSTQKRGKWNCVSPHCSLTDSPSSHFFQYCLHFLSVLVLIASCSIVLASETCEDEIFLIGRNPENCQNHFFCMIGRRIDFWCPDGEIFDVDRLVCRPGDNGSCEFTITPIPDNACENYFFGIFSHPDRFECQRFFVCMNYNMVQFECDPGFIFSSVTQSCQAGNLRNCN